MFPSIYAGMDWEAVEAENDGEYWRWFLLRGICWVAIGGESGYEIVCLNPVGGIW